MDLNIITVAFIRDFLIYFQLITAAFAILYYRKYKKCFLRYFMPLVVYTVVNDFFALFFYSEYVTENNSVLYNIYQVISFSYFLMLYKKAVSFPLSRKIISCFLPLYLMTVAATFFFKNFVEDYFVIPYLVGGGCVLISIIFYFIEILKTDTIIYINKLLLFWISVALLFLYTGSIPLMVARNYYSESPTIPYILNVNYFLNFIVNLLYISGFIWSGKDQKV